MPQGRSHQITHVVARTNGVVKAAMVAILKDEPCLQQLYVRARRLLESPASARSSVSSAGTHNKENIKSCSYFRASSNQSLVLLTAEQICAQVK